jgi:hypothetical protein
MIGDWLIINKYGEKDQISILDRGPLGALLPLHK